MLARVIASGEGFRLSSGGMFSLKDQIKIGESIVDLEENNARVYAIRFACSGTKNLLGLCCCWAFKFAVPEENCSFFGTEWLAA
jgi:hypothetical protein